MEAMISGRAGVALLWEGPQLFSLHLGDEEVVSRREWEIPFLLGDARDLRELKGASRRQVAVELAFEARQFDALHLALLTLDSDLSEGLREEAAVELEEVLGEDPRFAEFVENVLFSNPLPADGDLPGALKAAQGTEIALRVLSDFERHQSQIADAWIAWQGIPGDLFARSEDRQPALNAAVRSGGFRRLAGVLLEGEPVEILLGEALMNREVLAVPKHREIWAQWVKPLREESRYPEFRPEALYVAEPDDDSGEEVRGALLAALRVRLREEIQRLGLWEVSPSSLGIYGFESWEADSTGRVGEALDELLADLFVYIFVDRLRSLSTQVQAKDDIGRLVVLNIRHFLEERQQDSHATSDDVMAPGLTLEDPQLFRALAPSVLKALTESARTREESPSNHPT